jgi:hypothetical protein
MTNKKPSRIARGPLASETTTQRASLSRQPMERRLSLRRAIVEFVEI